jgi:hypothetical protein
VSYRSQAAWVATLVVIAVAIGLFFIFPKAFAFAELAARELRYLWWLILLVALSLFLIFGLSKKKP